MTVFWIITAALILLALAFIAPALLRNKTTLTVSDRDQQNVVIARERLAELQHELAAGSISDEEYERTKLELEQALLIDLEHPDTEGGSPESSGGGRWMVPVVALFIVSMTLSVYLFLGVPQLVDPAAMQAQQSEELPSVEEMVEALAARLKENPEDAEGWYLLGRTYMATKDFDKAAFAFDKLNRLVEDQPSIMLALADALAMASEGDMSGKPTTLVRRAVELAPTDQTALWLAGMVEDQAGNYAKALTHWRRLQTVLVNDPESLKRVDELLAATERKMAASGQTVSAPAEPEKSAAVGNSIAARITMSAELSAKAGPDESLFVYARALEGPRMPLAAVRLKVSDLPVTVELNDGQAMVPGMNLSSAGQVVVGARVSRSGNAIAASGDLLGEVSPVKVGEDKMVELEINSVIP